MSSNTVNVRRILNPFEPHIATPDTWTFTPNQPIHEYLEASATVNYVISVNGRLLTEAEHKTYIPDEEDFVVLSAIPYGGDDSGKSILRMVALIAVSFYAPTLAANFGAGAVGSIGNSIAAVGLSVAGSAVVNALLPPVTPSAPKAAEADSPTYGVDGAKNTSTEGIAVPVCYGEHRMAGNIIAMHTENDGDNQYLYMLLNAGEGPVAGFRDVLINDRPVSDFGEDVAIKYAYGSKNQPPIDWFSRVITPKNFNTALIEDEVKTFTLQDPMEEARLDFVCPGGLYDINSKNGESIEWTIGLEIDYRIRGQTAWTRMVPQKGKGLPVSVLPVLSDNKVNVIPPGEEEYTKLDRDTYASQKTAYIIKGFNITHLGDDHTYPSSEIVAEQVNAELGQYIGKSELEWPNREVTVGSSKHGEIREIAAPVKMDIISYADSITEMTSKSRAGVRRSFFSGKLQQGVYEFKIKRLKNYLGQGEQKYGQTGLVLADINLIQHEGVRYRNTALVAAKIKMTDNLNSIPNITFINEGKRTRQVRRVGTQLTETLGKSSNPAWILLDLATNTRFGGGMPTDRLIIPDMIRWAAYCESKGYTWNGVIDKQNSFWDTAQQVLRVGHSQMVGVGTRHSIVVDKPSAPVMMFGMGNIIKGSFQQSWAAKSERANEVDVTFADKKNLHKNKTIKVVDSKSLREGNKRQVASVTLHGVDNIDRAYKEGILILNMNREIHETVSFSAPTEAIACTVGSTIIVHHDMPKWADSGRLGVGSTRSIIKVDRPLTISAGHHKILILQDWGVLSSGVIESFGGNFVELSGGVGDFEPSVLRVNDEDFKIESWDDEGVYLETLIGISSGLPYELIKTDIVEEASVFSYSADSNTVELQTPLSIEPQAYTNFMVGKVESVKKLYRIKALSADSVNTRKISAIEYKEEVYDEAGYDGDGSVDITDGAPGSKNIGQVQDLVAYESAYIENRQVITKASVAWTQPLEGFYRGARLYTAAKDSSDFVFAKEVTFSTDAQTDIAINQTLKIKVVAFDMFGNSAPQESAPVVEITAQGSLTNIEVGEVSGADLLWSGRDCKIIWRYNSVNSSYEFGSEVGEADAGALDPQFLAYEVTVKNEDGSVRRVEKTTDPSYVYSYEKNFEDGISRKLIFEIRMIDIANNAGESAILTAYNAPPELPNLSIVPSFETALLNIVKPLDPDYAGVKVWMARTAEILDDVTSSNKEDLIKYRGGDGAISVGGLLFDADYYIKIAAFDVFGETDLKISPAIHFKTTHLDTDAIAEGVLSETVLTDLLQKRISLIDADDSVVDSVNQRLKKAAEVAKEGLDTAIETVSAATEQNLAAIQQETEARTLENSATAEQINTIAAKVDDNLSAINSEKTARANADSSIATNLNAVLTKAGQNTSSISSLGQSFSSFQTSYASQINQINSTFGSYSSSIQQVANSVDGVKNSYTVKIDNNGHISGYGLASTSNNGNVVSEFRVNANSFSIGLPGYPNEHPFTVGSVNGVPRVIIKNALIQDASIQTLKIAGNAVTHTLSAQTYAAHSLPPGIPVKTGVLQGTFNASQSPQAVMILVGSLTANVGDPANLTCSIRKNGVEIGRQSVSHVGGYTSSNFFMFSDPNPSSGIATYQILFGNDRHKGGTPVTRLVTGLVMATLR